MVNIAKFFIFLCTATIILGPVSASGQQSDTTGSYEVFICAGICSFDINDNVILKGHFVLFEEPIDQDIQDRLWADIDINLGDGKPTACFELDLPNRGGSRGRLPGNLGSNRNGFTAWRKRRDTGAVEFTLFRSRDARGRITVKKTGELFKGKVSNEFMNMKESYDVIARRIGEPDVMYCVPKP